MRALRGRHDGTIYQLVPLTTACRHTVGLNSTAIGIEHVGTSDGAILSNPRQLNASLAPHAWLMSTYGIRLRNVIGHSESLTSPFHKELTRPGAARPMPTGAPPTWPSTAPTSGASSCGTA